VAAGDGASLILAGAGSGKTRVLTFRIAYLIGERGIEPERILAVTFTNKAAQEMKMRVHHLVNDLADKQVDESPLICTFHSLCARILRRDGQRVGLAPSYLIYDKTDQLALIKQVMQDLDISTKRFRPHSILASISAAKNELIDASQYQKLARGYFAETAARVYPVYQEQLREAQAVDFDDLLALTVALFRENPPILEKYQEKFRHILIDEYQDTNHAQYVLTKQLAQEHQNLFVVGDAAQSIYSFRGADHRNLASLQKDFPDLKIFYLERNYRSTKTILRAANAVIRHNASHPVLTLYTRNQTGEPVKLYRAASETDEARFVAEKIIDISRRHPDAPADTAVLYRTNAQSRTFEEAFLRLGIPYMLVGGVKFYERKEVKDVLAYLRLLYNPHDRASRERAVKLGKRRLREFDAWAENSRLRLRADPDASSTRELLDEILKTTAYLQRFNPKKEDDLARLENIKELRSVASEFAILGQFLENVALVQQESMPDRALDSASKPVTLLTVHAAKGLEFSSVFMVGMEENLFPHSRSLFDKHELEEERRLAYVGMTRAKNRLFLTHARRRLYLGSVNRNQLSRFVQNIPPELTDEVF
jgi:DNA helicase-2/ATP-dependent DNA helicase PcrA